MSEHDEMMKVLQEIRDALLAKNAPPSKCAVVGCTKPLLQGAAFCAMHGQYPGDASIVSRVPGLETPTTPIDLGATDAPVPLCAECTEIWRVIGRSVDRFLVAADLDIESPCLGGDRQCATSRGARRIVSTWWKWA